MKFFFIGFFIMFGYIMFAAFRANEKYSIKDWAGFFCISALCGWVFLIVGAVFFSPRVYVAKKSPSFYDSPYDNARRW